MHKKQQDSADIAIIISPFPGLKGSASIVYAIDAKLHVTHKDIRIQHPITQLVSYDRLLW
jgi:hypothetical protein